jgi:hypothetical protein
LTIFTLLQSLFWICISPTDAARLKCADLPVAFEYEEPEEIKCLCATATAAVTFLTTLGLETTDVITIRLVEHLPPHQLHNLVGCYNPRSKEVDLLTYAKAVELSKKNKSMLASGLSEETWCSYAAHELSHAVSDQYVNLATQNPLAGEYIAAVTQLAVLSLEAREKVLKQFQNIEAYKSRSEMSVYYYLFAPNEFAVKCYLHYMSLDKPKEFIERLINEENGGWDGY